MAYEPKDGDFVLNINKRKEKPTHPDYSGHIRINGKKFFLNGWIKENKSTSEEFISGNVGNEMTGQKQFTPQSSGGFPGQKKKEEYPTQERSSELDPLDDTIPF